MCCKEEKARFFGYYHQFKTVKPNVYDGSLVIVLRRIFHKKDKGEASVYEDYFG